MSKRGAILGAGIGALVLLGAGGLWLARKKPAPRPRVIVTLSAPGLGADAMEQQIAGIERDVGTNADVASLTSVAREGSACMVVGLGPKAEATPAAVAIRSSINTRQLAPTTEPPLVLTLVPTIDLHVAVSDERLPGLELARRARLVADAIARVDNVREAMICGGADGEIAIHLDAARLAAVGVGIGDVASAVRRAPPASIEALGVTTVGTNGGANVRLSDVATISDGAAPPTCVATEDGRPAVVITVRVGVADDSPAHRAAIANAITGAAKELPLGAVVQAIDFDGKRTRECEIETPPGAVPSRVLAAPLDVPGVEHTWMIHRLVPPRCGDTSAPTRAIFRFAESAAPAPTLAAIERALGRVPGVVVRDLAADVVKADVWFSVPGHDDAAHLATQAAATLREVAGLDVSAPPTPEPVLDIDFDLKRLVDLGVRTDDVATAVQAAKGAVPLGILRHPDRPIVLRIGEAKSPSTLSLIMLTTPHGPVPLSALTSMHERSEMDLVRHDRQPAAVLHLRARSAGALRDAKDRLAKKVALPPGATMTFDLD